MGLVTTYVDLVRRYPALGRLLVGEFVSGIGDWLYLVAILIVVYAESNSPVLLGIIGAARILPYVLLSVPAGMVADRFNRRMVLIATDVARGVIMLALAAAVVLGAPIGAIIGLSILAACFSTFFGPAITALVPSLVEERDFGPANSALATLDNVAFIIGPGLAGLLLSVADLSVAFLLNAVTFAVVAVVLWRLPVAGRAGSEAPRLETDGEDAVRAHDDGSGWRGLVRPLAGPFALDSATSFVGGGLGVLTVVIAIDVLGAGEAGTGYLNAAIGVGGVVAGVAGGALLARRLGVPLAIGGVVGGVGLAWLAIAGNLVVAMLAIGVAVAGLLLLDVVNATLIMRIVPDDRRGRALGVLQTTSSVLYAAGSLTLPILADVTSVGTVLLLSAAVVVAGVVAALVLGVPAGQPGEIDPRQARFLRLPIFAGLPTPRLEAIAQRLEPLSVSAGQAVIRQGDAADRFYLVDAGTFRVTQVSGTEEERHLRDLGPGDVFGEIGLLRRTPRTASVTALSDGALLALGEADFRELVGAGPALSSRLLDLYRGAMSRS